MNWKEIKAAIFKTTSKQLKEVREFDYIDMDSLVGLEFQKKELIKNTQNFIRNAHANHALLWGERGCGKSSLAKAVFTKFIPEGLRVIQIAKDDLLYIEDILDEVRYEKYKFIIFCDDLSFEYKDISYKYLKPLLEGGIQRPPSNVLIYATSNRRHMIAEFMKDNENVRIENDEIHYKDAVEEKISLSDRFGLQLSFYQGNFDEYLKIVDFYFKEFKGDKNKLHEEAKRYSMLRASRSGRIAKQFYLAYKDLF